LSEGGEIQARQLAGHLANLNAMHWWHSPLDRARRTAELAASQRPWQIEIRLREIDFGRWEGLSFAQIPATDTPLIERWAAGDPNFGFPEGEKFSDFLARLAEFLEHFRAAGGDGVAVAHGGVIANLLTLALDLPPRLALAFKIDYATVNRLEFYDKGARLALLNSAPIVA